MGSFIDNLEEWLDSLSDEELLKSWEKSTAGMSDTGHYVDFLSESEFEFQYDESGNRYLIDDSNSNNYNTFYAPDHNIGSFSFLRI